MAGPIQETIISLKTEIDNPGVGKILSLLDSNKLKALAAGGAMAALTKAVYSFISAAVKQEFEYDKIAKKQKKSIEQTRAEQEALKSMGMTLNDIKKDKALKSIYDDLVKFNKEMDMPNAAHALAKVNQLRAEFWKLKSVVNHAARAIGIQIIHDLEVPLTRITGKMRNLAEFIRDKLPQITTVVSRFISAFSRGILAVGETFGKIVEYIGKLPAGIKGVGVAIGAVFALLKSGPIGQLIAAITLIGDLIRDFENYQYNKQNGFKLGDEGYVGNLNDFWGIWDIFDDPTKTMGEKAGAVGLKIVNGLTESINSIPASELGTSFGTMINNLFTRAGEFMSGEGAVGGLLGGGAELASSLVNGVLKFISSAFGAVNPGDIGSNLAKFVENIFSSVAQFMSGGKIKMVLTGASDVVTKLVKGVLNFLSGAFNAESLSNISTSIADFLNGLFTQIGEFLSGDGSGGLAEIPADILDTVVNVVSGIVNALVSGFSKLAKGDGIETMVTGLFDFIQTAISNIYTKLTGGELDLGETLGTLGEKIGEGIGAAIKIGIQFLTTMITECIEFLTSGEGLVMLMGIGAAIVKGILAGIGGLADGIMRAIFGDAWDEWKAGNQKRETTIDELWDKYGENGTVVDAEGNELGSVQFVKDEYVNSGADIDEVRKRLGLKHLSTYDEYQNELMSLLGIGDLLSGSAGTTLGTSKTPAEVVAQAWGANYNGTEKYFNVDGVLKYWGDLEGNFEALVSSLQSAENSEQLNAALLAIDKFMTSNGLADSIDVGDAIEMASESFATASSVMATSATTSSQQILSLGAAADVAAGYLLSVGSGDGKAWGGRIGSEGTYTVGEDGAEYIIPITKPERAISLINQMLSEMGSSAISRVMENFGLNERGTIGASASGLAGALQGMTMANTYNISAPININVSSNGSDPKAVGTSIYDAAERHLLKTLTGVTA